MSRNGETASGEEQDGQGTASVFDFLYNDRHRVGSYLAQLDENGLLTEIRRGEQASKNGKRGYSLGAQVFGTGGNVEVTPKEGASESSERVYDPFWANARELLDVLDERRMICRDLSAAAIGSVVLISGRMSVVDLSLFKALWGLEGIRAVARKGVMVSRPVEPQPMVNRHGKRAMTKQRPTQVSKSPAEESLDLMLEMLPVLPHSLSVIVSGAEGVSWANLKEEHLIGGGSDLILKHGMDIPGEWHMLGILDAHPDLGGQAAVEANNAINFADPLRLQSNSLVGQLAAIMSPIFRVLVGRPGSNFGITPLMIFRQVGHTTA